MLRLLPVLVLILTAQPALADSAPVPQLTVHGSAQLAFPADQARFNLAVVTTDAGARGALETNNTRLRQVREALLTAGLPIEECRTGHFEITPQWSPRPRDAQPDWQPVIVGYRVSNSLQVTTGRLPLVGPLIEAGVKAGANSIDDLSYGLADPATGRAAALAAATDNARKEAGATARAAGVQLGNILSLEVEPVSIDAPVRMMRMAVAEAAAPPLTPGEVTVRAGVTIVFAIRPE